MSAFLDKIINLDRELFLAINNGLSNSFFDAILPFMRDALNWAPLYLFLIVAALYNFGKKGAWWILFFIAAVGFADFTGNFIKHSFERPRPCLDPYISHIVNQLTHKCSSGFSFTSNHAANHFSMAAFFYFTTRSFLGKWAAIGFVWAAIISFAQVYVGVHYPLDIIGGSIVGLFFGSSVAGLFNKKFTLTSSR